MADMTTTLYEQNDQNHSRTFEVNGSTVSKPKLMYQRRKPAVGLNGSAEDAISIVYGAEDSGGIPLQGRISIAITVRRPIAAITADVDAAVALAREAVNSDNFTRMIASSRYFNE